MSSFFNKHWQYLSENENDNDLFEIIRKNRNVQNEDLDKFLNPDFSHLSDPNDFPNMQKVVKRILEAIENNENIVVFGDFDLDGITATAILYETLKLLKANVEPWLPSRKDGFGLSEKFAKAAIQKNVNLLITADCGIASLEAIKILKENSIDTIITDHHSVPKKIPPAFAIIHPQYPKKHETNFTGAGVAFKLAEALIREKFSENTKPFLEKLLELAAMGTVADLGELKDENRIISALGINSLKTTKNEGIKKLLENSKIPKDEINVESIAYFLAPRLNAAGRMSHPVHSLELLLGKVENAALLEDLNYQRRDLTETLLEEILKEIDTENHALIYKSKTLTSGIIGLLAGKIAENFNKPTIIIAENDDILNGSCRGPEDFHITDSLTEIAELFEGFGGHAQAAGFVIKKDKFAEFEEKFHEIVKKKRGKEPPEPTLIIDAKIKPENLNFESLAKLQTLEPFGNGFARPIFSFQNPEIKNIRCVGKDNNHLVGFFNGFSAIGFFCSDMENYLKEGGIEIAFTPNTRTWNGNKEIQLKIVDVRKI